MRTSTGRARLPRFSSGGRLFYWDSSASGGIRLVRYHGESDRFTVDKPVPVWAGAEGGELEVARRFDVTTMSGYDVDPSGQRFLMLERSVVAPEHPLRRPVVVLNWPVELGR